MTVARNDDAVVMVLDAIDDLAEMIPDGPQRFSAHGHNCGARTRLCPGIPLAESRTQGFQLVLSPDRTLTIRTAGDIPIPHHPTLSQQPADGLDPTIAPFSTDWNGDRMDLGYVVHVLLQHSN